MGAVVSFPGDRPQLHLVRSGEHWDVEVRPPQASSPILMRFATEHEALSWGLTWAVERGWRFRCWNDLLNKQEGA